MIVAAFEPTPLDRLREKLKESGFVQVQAEYQGDPNIVIIWVSGLKEFWRLKDEGAKP